MASSLPCPPTYAWLCLTRAALAKHMVRRQRPVARPQQPGLAQLVPQRGFVPVIHAGHHSCLLGGCQLVKVRLQDLQQPAQYRNYGIVASCCMLH